MKTEDAASPKDGDVSPINRSISNLIDEPKLSVPGSALKKKTESSFELRPNLSRATPAQLQHISFPSGRYLPVRSVSSSTSASGTKIAGKTGSAEKYAGGGGIILLVDLRPDEEAEFIDLEPPPPLQLPDPAIIGTIGAVVPSDDVISTQSGSPRPHIALDEHEPEAEPPTPFEVRQILNAEIN